MIHIQDVRKWSARIATAVLVAAMTMSFISVPAYAEDAGPSDGVEITLSPTKTKLSMDPGASKQGTFNIINTGDKEFTFKIYTSPYQVSNDRYDPTFNIETNRTQISRWITVPDEEFSLDPGDEAKVSYSVEVPSDVPSGGQYAVIFAETTSDEEDSASIVAKKRVGMLVYGNISGDTRDQGEITSHELKGWQHNAPLVANYRIKNTGNTDFAVTTQMTVKSLWGNEVYTSPEVENTVLPDTTRAVDLSWDKAGVGLYKASITAKFLDKSQTEERLVLVMSPILLVFMIVIIMLIVGGVFYALRRKKRNKKA